MLHGRPFLVVNTIFRPKGNDLKKGWNEDQKNWDVFENPIIVDKVSSKMMADATVIIDLFANDVVKSRHTMKDTMTLDLYTSRYKDLCEEGVATWTLKYAKQHLNEDLKTQTQRLIDMAKFKR